MPPSIESANHDDIGTLPLLRDELNEVSEKASKFFKEDGLTRVQKFIQDMKASDILDLALKKGDFAPDFALPDHEGNMVSSADLLTKGPLVVVFFRGNWCGYCDTTLRVLRRYTPHIRARGATIVAISPQTVEKSASLVKDAGLDFSVVSDLNSEYSQLCNIAFTLTDEIRTFLDSLNVDLTEINGDDSMILPIPATYVIEKDGRVTYSFLDVDFSKRAEPLDILNALPSLDTKKRKTSLNERIGYELAKIRDQLPDLSVRDVFDEIDRLHSADVESAAIRVGDMSPDFKLYDKEGELVDSKRLRRKGPMVVTFYHGQESPLCVLALQAMQKYHSKMRALGASVVAIGPDMTPEALRKLSVLSGARFPLLSDYDSKVAKQFGIAHEMVLPFQTRSDNDSIHTAPPRRMLPLTATYIVDRSGCITYSFVNADHTKRAEPSDVLRILSESLTASSKGMASVCPDKAGQPRRHWTRKGPFSLVLGRRLASPNICSSTSRVAKFFGA